MWDANRVKLMTQILKSLAKQHKGVCAGMLTFDFDDDSVNLLPDPFWKLRQVQLPKFGSRSETTSRVEWVHPVTCVCCVRTVLELYLLSSVY